MAKTTKTSSTKKKTTTSRTTAAPKKNVAASAANNRVKVLASGNLNPNRLLAELVGTFVLTLVIVAAFSGKFTFSFFASPDILAQAAASGQSVPAFSLMPWLAGFALATLVLATYKISGGHLNPAITAGFVALRRMNVVEGAGYVVAQLLGAMLALSVATRLISVMDPQSGKMAALDPAALFSHAASWNVFTAEVLGAAVFGFGVAAATVYAAAITRSLLIGSSLILGAAVASVAGAGVLNPAVAVGLGLIGFGENLWPLVGIYVGGTTLGMIIGMALHTLLSREAVKA